MWIKGEIVMAEAHGPQGNPEGDPPYWHHGPPLGPTSLGLKFRVHETHFSQKNYHYIPYCYMSSIKCGYIYNTTLITWLCNQGRCAISSWWTSWADPWRPLQRWLAGQQTQRKIQSGVIICQHPWNHCWKYAHDDHKVIKELQKQ